MTLLKFGKLTIQIGFACRWLIGPDRLYRNDTHASALEIDFDFHIDTGLLSCPKGTRDVAFLERIFGPAHGRGSLRDEPDWERRLQSSRMTSKVGSIVNELMWR
jgi:hypothetical protein